MYVCVCIDVCRAASSLIIYSSLFSMRHIHFRIENMYFSSRFAFFSFFFRLLKNFFRFDLQMCWVRCYHSNAGDMTKAFRVQSHHSVIFFFFFCYLNDVERDTTGHPNVRLPKTSSRHAILDISIYTFCIAIFGYT